MYVPPGRRDNGANPHAHEFVPGGYQGAQQATAYDPRGASQQQPQQQFYAAAQQQPAQHQVHYAAAGQAAYYQPAQQAGAGQQQAYAYAAPATAGHQAQAPPQQAPTAAVSHQHQDPNAGQPRLFFGQQGGHHGGGGYGGHHGGGGYGGHHGGGGYGGHHGGGAGGFGGHPGVGGNGFGGFFSQGHRQQFTQDPFHGLPATQQHVREDRPDDQLFQDHAQGINFDLYDNIQVTVKPNNITPAESFQAMSLHPLLVENIARCRYEKPTPVQKNGIPIVVAGADLMACAQTGSGKTAAYLLPAVHFCLTKGTFPSQTRQATPTALIMAPTRELCVQIYDEGRKFTFRTGMRCVVVYGGADARQQMYELQRGCSILVATPGRLWEMFQRNVVSFRAIQFLVLDEADRMLDMGFEPQIRAIVEGAETDMPRTGSRQTLMYSATFPRDIQTLAREFLSQHYFLQVGRVGSTTENITQEVAWVEDYEKKERLLQYIQQFQDHLTLIFVEKKRDADYIERFLQQCHLPATSIHGDRVQREREEALAMFRSGMCRILVATDVASRGLDIPDVGVVIQYDLPTNIEDYVHRIGRTGRAGKRGSAVAFFCEKNRSLAEDLSTLLTEARQVVPDFITAMVPPKHHHHHHNHRGGGGFRGRGGGRGGFRGGQRGGFSGFRGGQQRAPGFQPAPQ